MAKLVAAADQLAVFIAQNNTRPWSPGIVDCCIVLADWAMWCGHQDPAVGIRGSYQSDDGFRAIVAAHHSLVGVVGSSAATIGLKPATRPSCGDIGVIGSPLNIHRQFGAIHDGVGWLVRMHGGFGRMTARTLAAWEI